MMKTLFEITVAYDIGDAESGPLVRESTDYYDCSINLFQPITDIFNEVSEEYRKEYADDPEFVGCIVKRLVPEEEAKGIRESMYDYDQEGYDLLWA